jgi:hypothetical protein
MRTVGSIKRGATKSQETGPLAGPCERAMVSAIKGRKQIHKR